MIYMYPTSPVASVKVKVKKEKADGGSNAADKKVKRKREPEGAALAAEKKAVKEEAVVESDAVAEAVPAKKAKKAKKKAKKVQDSPPEDSKPTSTAVSRACQKERKEALPPNPIAAPGEADLRRMVQTLVKGHGSWDFPPHLGPPPRACVGGRAAYLERVVPSMLQGCSATAPDAADATVVRLLEDGYAEHGRLAAGLRLTRKDAGHCAMQVAIRLALELCGEEAPPPAASSSASAASAGGAESWRVRMHLGKHKGWLLGELPARYLEYMCAHDSFFSCHPELRAHLLALGLLVLEDGRAALPLEDSRTARWPYGIYCGTLISELADSYIDWVCEQDVGPDRYFNDSPQKQALLKHLLALGRVRRAGGSVVPAHGLFGYHVRQRRGG